MRTFYYLTFIVISGFLSGHLAARETLVLTTHDNPPLHMDDGSGFVDVLEREMFNRIGYDVQFDFLPGERALLHANRGIADGATDRIAAITKFYPNLITVPETIMSWNFVVFSKRDDIKIESWESVKPYSVGVNLGWNILERNTKDALVQTKVETMALLFTLLENERADLVITESWQGLYYLKFNPKREVKLLEPPIARKIKFLHLHKKHQDLSPKLAAALREMKADGTYDKIVDQVLTPLKLNQ